MGNRAVFFDRDGTLNAEVGFLHTAREFLWMPGAIRAVKYCNDHAFLAIVITNQSGVARGFYPEEDVTKLFDWMNGELARHGAHLDAQYYCPHHPEAPLSAYRKVCDCRKPKSGLIDRACADYDIDRDRSFFVGDRESDMACARNAGVEGILYAGGDLSRLLALRLEAGEGKAP